MPGVCRLRGLIALTLVGSVGSAAPSGASAQGDVFVDPDRPAGTEYVIPHESARRGTSPDATARAGDDGSVAGPVSPAFGSGVETNAAPKDQGRSTGRATDPGGFTSGDAARAVAALRDPADGGVPVGLITAGAALCVLLLAGAVFLATRRARSSP